MYYSHFASTYGNFFCFSDGSILSALYFESQDIPNELILSSFYRPELKIFKETQIQVLEFLDLKRRFFALPTKINGTVFEKKVWIEICKLRYGETTSYAAIAKKIGNPKAYRAVGRAIGRNPLLLVIPCHRVIRKNGQLAGFAAGGTLKKEILNIERK